jgi:rhamnosyltransferase
MEFTGKSFYADLNMMPSDTDQLHFDIAAVVVTYHPNILQLKKLIVSLSQQCKRIHIIDNSEPSCSITAELANQFVDVDVISLEHNSGLGVAQNIGIHRALYDGADAVLLFDQDSTVASSFVKNIWHTYLLAQRANSVPIAAIGPRYTDLNQDNRSPFVRLSGLKIVRVPCKQDSLYVEVDCLIASGSLLLRDALCVVGMMREDLFIDYVDTEWCLRAKQMGYRCIGACSVEMQHSIGDEVDFLWGRPYTLHTPLRHYYLMRNATALYFHSSLPLQWKVADGIRLFFKFSIYSMLAKPRTAHIRMMIRGVWHGIIGRMGRL